MRADADGIAVVAPDLEHGGPSLRRAWSVVGLRLNFPKTVAMPQGDAAPEEVADRLGRSFLGGSAACRSWARYLGFVIGSGGVQRAWGGPLAKLRDRSVHWGAAGSQIPAAAWSTYLVSLLGFVAQLAGLPADGGSTHARAMRKLVPGPVDLAAGLARALA